MKVLINESIYKELNGKTVDVLDVTLNDLSEIILELDVPHPEDENTNLWVNKSEVTIIKEIREAKFSKEIISNLLCSAIEGGSNFWYNFEDLSMLPKETKGEPLVDRIMDAVFNHNIQIPVFDIENEGEILGYITQKNIIKAEKLMEENEEWEAQYILALNDEGDADTGDVWFQFVVMGEVQFG